MTHPGASSQADPAVPAAATTTVAGASAPRTVADHLLDGSETGVVAYDERRVVRSANPAALRLLPGLTVGYVLCGAELAGLWSPSPAEVDPIVDLVVGGRRLAAHRQSLPDGWTGWHLHDVTEPQAQLDSLLAERARTTGVLKRSLLEPTLPTVAGMTLGGAYRPPEEGLLIGGDFYDVQRGSDASTMLLLGDVCGKGVDAAVSKGQLRQSVRALRQVERDPVRLLDLLNSTMLEAEPEDADPRFVTLVLGTARPLPGGGLQLRLAGGGHPPPLIVRRSGVETVEIGGALVGALPSARFASRTVDLAPGEACVLYTDGVIGARGGVGGGQLFGEARLAELLDGCHVQPAPGIAERVAQHATCWLAGKGGHDDIAVLVVQAPLPVNPAPSRRHLHAVQPLTGESVGENPVEGETEEPV